MLEQLIADFYAANDCGLVRVVVRDGMCYIAGDHPELSGTAYDKDEIELAAMATVLDVAYIHA